MHRSLSTISPRGRRALALQAASDDQHTVSVHCIQSNGRHLPTARRVLSSGMGQVAENVVLGGKGPKRTPEGFLKNQNKSLRNI